VRGHRSALGTAMDLRVQLSSCVPATELETSGARLGDIRALESCQLVEALGVLVQHARHVHELGEPDHLRMIAVGHQVGSGAEMSKFCTDRQQWVESRPSATQW
jgi:adenine deaminase